MHNETELEVRLTELAKSREPQPTAGGEWLDLDEQSERELALQQRLAQAEAVLNEAYTEGAMNKAGRYPVENYFKQHGLTFVYPAEED